MFCISRLTEGSRQMDLSFSENLGHVLGPLAAVLLAYTLPGSEEAVLCAASCCFVCLTLLSALWITRKEGDYEKT